MIEQRLDRTHPDRALVKKILDGTIPNVEIVKGRWFRYEVKDDEERVVYSREHRMETLQNYTIGKILEKYKYGYKVFINIASKSCPYFLGEVVYNPHNFQPYRPARLDVCAIPLTGDMRRHEERRYEKAMEEHKKAIEFEQQFIDDTDYEAMNRYYRLLTLKNN